MANKPAKSKEKNRHAASRNAEKGCEEIESKEKPRIVMKKLRVKKRPVASVNAENLFWYCEFTI